MFATVSSFLISLLINRKQTICYGKTKFFLSLFFIAKWYLYTEIKTLRVITRSSHPMCSVEKGVLKNFEKISQENIVLESTLSKKSLQLQRIPLKVLLLYTWTGQKKWSFLLRISSAKSTALQYWYANSFNLHHYSHHIQFNWFSSRQHHYEYQYF